jgi:acetyl esterase/lipase
MASKENQQARRYWEELSAALTPGDGAELTIDELRAAFDKWAEQSIALSPEARLEHVVADGVPCIWARMPGTSTARTIVYYHGGGYLLGSATAYAGFGAALSAAADAQVLVVDYRLAPENPHPAALEDSATAYRWALRQGADAGSTVVAGDSAGGGLALAVIDSLRAAGESLPAAAVCLSPWVDMTFAGESYLTNAGVDPIITKELLGGCAEAWLAGQDPEQPSASPLFADLTGLPPTLILVGSCEALYDEAVKLAHRAAEDGVDATLAVGDDMHHIWPVMSSFLPEAKESLAQIGEFVRKHTE